VRARARERARDFFGKCLKIKVRVERKCGELLAQTVEHGGDRKTESRSNHSTLNDIGLTRDQSSRYQQLAAMPDDSPLNFDDTLVCPQ
jgi:hypothetical protein